MIAHSRKQRDHAATHTVAVAAAHSIKESALSAISFSRWFSYSFRRVRIDCVDLCQQCRVFIRPMAATTPAASRRQKGQKKQQRRDSPSQSMDPSSNELPANEQSAAGAGVENDDCAEPTSFGSSVVGGRSFALRYVARQSARWHPLLVLGVALYSFSDHHALHGKLVYDDKATIQFNQIVQGMAPISDVFYYDYWGKDLLASNESHKSFRPVTTLSFRLDNFIGGGSTYPFHVTNVIAHAVTSCLLYACGRVIFQSAGVVLLASLFFATHPVHSESVSNITGTLLVERHNRIVFVLCWNTFSDSIFFFELYMWCRTSGRSAESFLLCWIYLLRGCRTRWPHINGSSRSSNNSDLSWSASRLR